MKLQGGTYFIIGIIALMVAMIILTLGMQYTEAKILPLILGGLILVLALTQLVSEVRKTHQPAEKVAQVKETGEREEHGSEETVKEAQVGFRRYVIAWAWLLGFFLGIYLFGFIPAITVFILTYQKSHGTGWQTTIISAIVAPALIYLIFEFALNVDLYPGLFLQALG